METVLQERGIVHFKPLAAPMGGKGDQGREMTEKGRQIVSDAICRNSVRLIMAKTVRENIDERMNVYLRSGKPAAYINMGGGVAATGIRPFKVFSPRFGPQE
jgi:poly-gamma-glutamate system protein